MINYKKIFILLILNLANYQIKADIFDRITDLGSKIGGAFESAGRQIAGGFENFRKMTETLIVGAPSVPQCFACEFLLKAAKENNTAQALEALNSHDPLLNLDQADQTGTTPLIYAARYGNLDLVKKLVNGLNQPYWIKVAAPPLESVSVGFNGSYWGLSTQDSTKYPGSGKDIYRINCTKTPIMKICSWVQVDGALKQISLGKGYGEGNIFQQLAEFGGTAMSNTIWGINNQSTAFMLYQDKWKMMSNPNTVSFISIGGDGAIWGLSANGQEILKNIYFDQTKYYGLKIPNLLNLTVIAVGYSNFIWGINSRGQVYKLVGTNWQEIPAPPGGAKTITVTADLNVWALSNTKNNMGYDIYKFENNAWIKIDGGLKQISAGNYRTVLGVDNNGVLYKWSGITSNPKADIDQTESAGIKRTALIEALFNINPDQPQTIDLNKSCTSGCQAAAALFLINQFANVNKSDIYGTTPLHIAINIGNLELINALVHQEAKLDARNNDGNTPLHEAISTGNMPVINLLISLIKQNKVTQKDFGIVEAAAIKNNAGKTPIDLAQENKFRPQALSALNNAVTAQQTEQTAETAENNAFKAQDDLIAAAKTNNYKVSESILNSDIVNNSLFNIDNRDKNNGMSAANYAASFGNLDLIKLLFSKNADLDSSDLNKNTPLIWAISKTVAGKEGDPDYNKSCKQNCFAAVAIFLIDRALVNPNKKDKNGNFPLQFAIDRQQKNIINSLLKQSVSLKNQDNLGNNIFFNLFATKNPGFIKWALNYIANNSFVNISNLLKTANLKKVTPLDYAKSLNSPEIIKIIEDAINQFAYQ